MVKFVSDSTNDDLLHVPNLKKSSKEPLDSQPNDYSFADSFLDYDSIENWIEELSTPVMSGFETVVDGQALDLTVQGQFSNQSALVSDSILVKAEPIVVKAEPIDLGFELAVDQAGGDRDFRCVIEEEISKVGLVAETKSLVLDDGKIISNQSSRVFDSIVVKAEPIDLGFEQAVDQTRGDRDFKCVIEEGMSKVSLVAETESLVLDDGKITDNSELESDEDDSESDVESPDISLTSTSSSNISTDNDEEEESSSSSSGSSSFDEEEENESIVKLEQDGEIGELEEGEIRDLVEAEMTDGDKKEVNVDHMVSWNADSDDDDDDDEDVDEENEEIGVQGGPIRSENELKVLPHVPQVHATLQPHHQMLPVGVVLSIMGRQVIVEGVEKHNPLSEGSVLWITESRSPLGLVDEIFGPVKNPYYSVRYNLESEVPSGTCGGTQISFVPDFANYVLNNKDLYKKGYDASGLNDEEVTDEDDFSDDEKELEFKRMQRFAKRAMNDQKDGNRNNTRKKKNTPKGRKFGQHTSQHPRMPEARNGQPISQHARMPEARKNGQPPAQQANMNMVQPSSNQNQLPFSTLASFVDHGGRPNLPAPGQCFINGNGINPSFPPMYNPCFTPAMNGMWPTNMPFQQPQLQQNPFFLNNLPMNGMPWLFHNPSQQSPQMQMMNTFTAPTYPQGFMGTTLPGLPNASTSLGEQGVHQGGIQFGQNQNLPVPGCTEVTPQFNPVNLATTQQFNPGNSAAAHQFNPGNSAAAQQFNPGNPAAAQQFNPGNPAAAQQFNPGNSAAAEQFNPGNSAAAQQFNPGNSAAAQQFNPGNSAAAQQFNPGNSTAAHQFNPGNSAAAQQFSPGTSSSRGRIPHNRGGAHFRGRRGRR